VEFEGLNEALKQKLHRTERINTRTGKKSRCSEMRSNLLLVPENFVLGDRNNQEEGRPWLARDERRRGGSKETSVALLEQCSGAAYRWDTEIQRSVLVLGQATSPSSEPHSPGETLLA